MPRPRPPRSVPVKTECNCAEDGAGPAADMLNLVPCRISRTVFQVTGRLVERSESSKAANTQHSSLGQSRLLQPPINRCRGKDRSRMDWFGLVGLGGSTFASRHSQVVQRKLLDLGAQLLYSQHLRSARAF